MTNQHSGAFSRIAVIYHFFPHYRSGVINELCTQERTVVTFIGGPRGIDGIRPFEFTNKHNFIPITTLMYWRFVFQPYLLRLSLTGKYDAVIFLANPYFLTTWLAAIILRLRGKRIIFWGHGWLREEPKIFEVIKKMFFSLADDILVYSERAKQLGEQKGFCNIKVFYNSLDFGSQIKNVELIESGELKLPVLSFRRHEASLIICTARLTTACRFDLLIEALALLERGGLALDLLLIGDGPQKQALVKHAAERQVNAFFYGECYDEKVIGPLLFSAELTVSPGKVGLTAIHSMTYGTPVITHDNVSHQMPEHEAIVDGITGTYFSEGDALSLAETIKHWLKNHPDRVFVRKACMQRIQRLYTPEAQLEILNSVLKR
jgi:glycosyltransferase involved in cell wall biosynthesis